MFLSMYAVCMLRTQVVLVKRALHLNNKWYKGIPTFSIDCVVDLDICKE